MSRALRVSSRFGVCFRQNISSVRVLPSWNTRSFFTPENGPNITNEKPHGLYTPKPAVDLVHESAPTEVTTTNVCCDGGGPLGHPKVFINLETVGKIKVCIYCGERYVRIPGSH